MIKNILIALAALALGSCAVPPDRFSYACAEVEAMIKGASCDGLKHPVVVETYMLEVLSQATRQKWHGSHVPGEKYIFWNPSSSLDKESVLLHETVHYILGAQEKRHNMCRDEEIAYIILAKWEGKEYDTSWKKNYSRCL